MLMPAVMTPMVVLFVNVMLGILEMDLIVQVSEPFIPLFNFFNLSAITYCLNVYCFIDINECLANPCHVNATCNDTEGSFVCQCDAGYSGNGFNCSSRYTFHSFL